MPILIGLSWIEKVKDMWPISLFGFCVYVFGVILATFIYGGIHPGPPEPHDFFVWNTFPLFIGTATYSLEGINLVLPIENSMERGEDAQMVFFTGTMFYTVLVAGYGAFAYMQGFSACDLITDCLPAGVAVIIIRVALVLSLLATHTITLFPAVEMLEELLFNSDTTRRVLKKRAMCTVLVLLTGVGAAAIGSNFGLFSSLVGSIFITVVGFFVPVMMYVQVFKEEMSLLLWLACSLTFMFGVAAMVSGTYVSILSIVQKKA